MSLLSTVLFLVALINPILGSSPLILPEGIKAEEDGILVFEEESDYEEKMSEDKEAEEEVLED